MTKIIPLRVVVIMIFFLSFAACKKVDINFGSQVLDNNYTQIIKVDTITPSLTTVFTDSFVTSGSGVALAGIYKDPAFGLVTAKSYFELAPPKDTSLPNDISFDSLTLILKLNKTYYGDTAKSIHLNVYQLADNIFPPNNGSVFYNNSSVRLSSESIGEKDVVLSPVKTDSIVIRLSQSLGQELFDLLKAGDSRLKNNEKFINYFRGLSIVPSGDDALVFGFKDSISMRLHYTIPGLVKQTKVRLFNLINNGHQFNNIHIVRSGALANIPSNKKEINSTTTNNTAFVQSITGTVAKISFPSIKDILQIPGYVKILQAQLIIKPVLGSYDMFFPLPNQLRLSRTDNNNKIGTDLLASSSSGSATTQNGNLIIDNIFRENTAYNYDVTDYLSALVRVSVNNQDGLLASQPAPAFSTTFNRLLIGNANTGKSKLQLVLYYLSIQQ